MTDRTVDAADWIARQPKAVQASGEARGARLIRDATFREFPDRPAMAIDLNGTRPVAKSVRVLR